MNSAKQSWRHPKLLFASAQTKEIVFLDSSSSPVPFSYPHQLRSKNKLKLLTEFDSPVFSNYTLLLIVHVSGF